MSRRSVRVAVSLLASVAMVIPLVGIAPAVASTSPTISSDQPDYPPGATVTLTGTGWASGEAVHIFVNDDAGQTWSHNSDPDPVADADGNLSYAFVLPSWFVANYSVMATGPVSGTATTTFTDLAIGTYDQCSNDDGDGYASGDTGCRWINGNLQSNNSTYIEGDATVQRLWLTDFAPGSTHTVTMQYGTTKGGKHAYDFLTTWDWSESWVSLADRCQDITGCTTAGETSLDIPQDPNVPDSFEPSAPGDRQFVMRGGTLNNATTPVIESGSYAGDSETIITVTFTVADTGSMCAPKQGVTTCDIALWFGAHVAAQANWGLGQGAGGISGSPYHVALYKVDGASVGQRDNQMQANAITPNGTIVIVKDAVPNNAQDFSFNLTDGGAVNQSFSLDDDADPTLPSSQTFSVPPGTWTASELNVPSGWDLTSIVCVDPSSNTTVNLGAGTATINLASLETVTCTYTNTKEPDKLDLTVSKTVEASFTRTYTWGIDKSADKTEVDIADGGTATFTYTVDVTHDDGVDSGWAVEGQITVTNPNGFSVSGVSVSDSIDDANASCTVTGGSSTIAASDDATFDYTCTYSAAPAAAGQTNTATATWTPFGSPNDSASGTAPVDWSDVSPTLVDEIISVTDPLDDQAPRTFSYTDPSPTSFSYQWTTAGVAGTCTDYDNTATFTTNDTGTTGSDAATVKVCVGVDLTVTKTASGTFDRTYLWEISKNADETSVAIADGGSYTFHYTVDVEQTGVSDTGWQLSGIITITNPNDWQDITLATLTDVVDNGGTCNVAPGPYVVPKSGSLPVSYSCSYASAPNSPSGTNTATATWDKTTYHTPNGSDSGSAGFTLGLDGTTNKTIHVTDSYAGALGTVTGNDSAPFASASFTYDRTEEGIAGECTTYDNTATITETGQDADASVELCVGKDLTVTKTARTEFTRTYTWDIDKSVDETEVNVEGADPQSATFNYTVEVTHDAGTDTGWKVLGQIEVSNPNAWQAIDANVTDLVNVGGGASCLVEGEAVHQVTVPAADSVTLDYECTFSSKPSYSGLNTATATWDGATYHTPNGSTTGTANVSFTTPTTIVDGTVTVVDDKTDPNNPVTLGTASYTQANPITFTYSLVKAAVSGECTDYTNTATFTTNTTETTGSDEQTVTVCSSQLRLLKLTGVGSQPPVVDASMSWTFKLYDGPHGSDAPASGSGWLGTALASDSTSGDLDGILDFDGYHLDPNETYTVCELSVPSGYTVEWKIDTNGDGTVDTVVIPYNPNAKDPVPGDLGTRCFDFGAGTSYGIPQGDTLVFRVVNHFPGGAPRTPGYWKNWNRCTGGGQAANADRNGGRDKGYTLLEDILTAPGIIWDDILSDDFVVPITTCEQAVEILDQRVVILNGKVGDGKKLASDGARTLAMHLLAAQLNEGNGACINQDVKDVILAGERLLDKYNFDGKKTTAYLTKGADYTYALQLAKYLDAYNNSNCNFGSLPPKPTT